MEFLRRLRKAKERPEKVTTPTEFRPPSNRAWVGWATDVGKVRGHNEDAVLVVETHQEGDQSRAHFGLFAIADGMGGHQSGEVASALATRVVASHIVQQVQLPILAQEEHSTDRPSLNQILIDAVNQANSTVTVAAPGGGTTLTCALLLGRSAHIAHVGDSRAYIVSEQGLEQITRDHSLVDRLVELGQLTSAEAANHPQKNVLYRAVGQSGTLEVDTYLRSIPPGCGLLLCTDGLWGLVSEEQMAKITAEAPSPQAACQALIAAANAAGGKDNATAVLIQLPGK
jgi:serine/threonine protein phosphatase PrpC